MNSDLLIYEGISLRDYFAGQALTGLLSMEANPRFGVSEEPFSIPKHVNEIAGISYLLADAMLEARKTESDKQDG